MDCLQYFSCWFFPSSGQTTNTIARKNGLRYGTIVRRSYGTNEWHSCSLRKRIRTDGPVSQAELAAHDKLSLPVCLARLVPKRGGSCGNSPRAADGSVLFRSMPFPCPQNIRSLIMAMRRRQQPATVRFNYVLRCSRPTPLRARSACCATLRNFGVACSQRSLNYRFLAKIPQTRRFPGKKRDG